MKILSRQRLLSTGGMVCALLAGPMAPSRAETGVPAKQIVVGQSAAFIREMKKANSNPQFINVSFVGSRALANELGEAWHGVGITRVVPLTWNPGVPVVGEHQRLFSAYSGKSEFSFATLEGFFAAKVPVEGLRRSGTNLTRERFIAAMENFRFDTGGFAVRYSPDYHSGSRFVELTVITKQRRFLR